MAAHKYEQRLRAQQSEAVRRRILEAVYERLRQAPTDRVTVDCVARAAGVARSTVYLIFGSRAGLFDALGTDLLRRGGLDDMLRATAHPGAPEGLRGGIYGEARMFAANRDVLRVLYSMAQLDADAVGGTVRRMEDSRARGARYRAGQLAEQGILRPDVTIDQAIDLLWLLTGFDTFDLLFTGRGLSADKVAERLVTIAERALCRQQ